MGAARAARHEHAHGRIRARRPPGGRGVEHARPLPLSRVVVYTAPGCSLCGPALEAVREACGDDFELVDISGDPALEASYRASLPVVEVDGERAFSYFVDADKLRALLR